MVERRNFQLAIATPRPQRFTRAPALCGHMSMARAVETVRISAGDNYG